MTHKVYTVFDVKLGVYSAPFLAINKNDALRKVQDVLEDPRHLFTKHAEDFTLFEIGQYDDEKGRYEMHNAHEPMGTLLEHKSVQTAQREI